jgi:ribose transport system permease protein
MPIARRPEAVTTSSLITDGTPPGSGTKASGTAPIFGAGKSERRSVFLHVLSHQGLMIFGLLLVLAYSILLPRFFSSETVTAILSISAIVAFLALAEMIVITTANYDLSIGYSIGLLHILAMGLLAHGHVYWPLVVVIIVVLGGLVGLVNGILVEYAKIDSFIATLGVGTMLYGLGALYTNGAQVVGSIPKGFANINYLRFFGLPLPAIIVGLLVLVLWACFEFLPIGRRLYAVGSNRRAAELTGIPARRLVIGAFVACGLVVGLDAVVLAARLQVGQSTVGPEFLLPAFVGALLGATTVRPGRVNALGTIIAVLVLAIGIAGLQQFGLGFYVEPLFQGASLIISVGLAGYAARRRAR